MGNMEMKKKIKLISDLSNIQLEDHGEDSEAKAAWIQYLHTIDNAKHPQFDEITTDNLKGFVKNFKKGIPKDRLPVDFFHMSFDKAAGWITNVRLTDNGNMIEAFVEFTPNATQMIEDKEILFFSPTFTFKHITNTGEVTKDVLLGGALTNAPFLELSPIKLSKNFSGVMLDQDTKQRSTKNMDEITRLSNEKAELSTDNSELKVKLSKQETEMVTLAAKNTKLEAEKVELSKIVDAIQKEKESAEFETQFKVMLDAGTVTPAQKDFLKSSFDSKGLIEYAKTAPKVVALAAPNGSSISDSNSGLTEIEQSVCDQLGKKPEDMIKYRSAA